MHILGAACFVCSDDNTLTDLGTTECPLCSPPVTLDLSQGQWVLEHMGSHILHEPTLIQFSMALCGLCLHPAPLCSIFLKKGKGANASLTINPKSSRGCLVKVKYLYRVASESTASSLCSNVLLQCPLCPKSDPAIWRYFLKVHFQEKHKGVSLAKYEDLWKLTNIETTEMKKIWLKQAHTVVKQTKKSKLLPLIISEDHRAQIPAPAMYV